MGTLLLNVKTVQAFEPVTYEPHTAYTVYAEENGDIAIASAWTLRDAISLFAHIYSHELEQDSPAGHTTLPRCCGRSRKACI